MSALDTVALAVVLLVGLYLFALGAASFLVPARASRFLLGFASSGSMHFAEMFLRLVAGAGFVVYAPRMQFSGAFGVFGWVLVVTTAVLLILPWRWHHRFAQRAVPLFTSHIAWVGLVSLASGALVLWAAARGSVA